MWDWNLRVRMEVWGFPSSRGAGKLDQMGTSLECVQPDPRPPSLQQPGDGAVLTPFPEEEAKAQSP